MINFTEKDYLVLQNKTEEEIDTMKFALVSTYYQHIYNFFKLNMLKEGDDYNRVIGIGRELEEIMNLSKMIKKCYFINMDFKRYVDLLEECTDFIVKDLDNLKENISINDILMPEIRFFISLICDIEDITKSCNMNLNNSEQNLIRECLYYNQDLVANFLNSYYGRTVMISKRMRENLVTTKTNKM